MTPQYDRAFNDISLGLLRWRMWSRLGWGEVRRRYRRTAVGPFWTTFSLGIFIFALSMVWSGLWKMDVREFLPFLCAGMITWYLLSAIITEGCVIFVMSESLIKQMSVSYTLIACAMVWRNIIVFGHNFLVYVVVAVLCGVSVNAYTFLVIPGLALVAINGAWVGMLFGTICTRFRDLQQLVTSLLQIAMFATPIFWRPEQLESRLSPIFIELNPLYRFIDVVRAPLMGQLPQTSSWTFVIAATIIGWTFTLAVFSRFRRRIPYWI
jgi:ABC-type polysaccharide/polyol phosphate export permease